MCRTVPSDCQSFPHANLMIDPRCKQSCDANSTVTADGNIPGGDLRKIEATSWGACAVACEAEPLCQGWTFDCCNNSRPGSTGCYIKSTVSAMGTFRGDYSGCSSRGVATSPSACCGRDAVSYSVPPHGMRSAVALGPVGGGSLELRADGRLADWRLLNNQPPRGATWRRRQELHGVVGGSSQRVSAHGVLQLCWRAVQPQQCGGCARCCRCESTDGGVEQHSPLDYALLAPNPLNSSLCLATLTTIDKDTC